MASWLRLFLLKTITVFVFIITTASFAIVHAEENISPLQVQSEQLIQPEVTRRDVRLDKIDTEDFEVSVFSGLMNIEDFGTNAVLGGRFAYHVNEDIFVEATLAKTTAGKSSAERLGPFTAFSDRDVTYYNFSLGYNLLPGESFLTKKTSFNSAVYVIGGIGSTTFAGDNKLTLNMGGGFRLLATDWLAMHVDVRNHIFNIDILGENKTANNIEITIGLSAFF
ncbi:MAG: outer membrane beta-barrel domain-containing protein [Gammaproteobacteria bacterium]|nr:outer membrane beta-barrel domain-containing protein [Gammaproteobacteria bacterium]